MKDYFENKSILVTGASSGIGRGIAELLARRGASVTVMARTPGKLDELNRETGGNMLVAPGDVTKEEDCVAAVQEAIKIFGKLDGVIHNAGVSMRALARETDIQVYRDLMEVNFFSMLHFFRHALKPLLQTKGHLVAVSSMMGRYSTQERSGYNASKHAIQGFMDSVRLELMGTGVHVMVVSPGFVQTRGSQNALTGDGTPYAKMDEAIAGGLTTQQCAQVVLDGMEKRKRDVFPAGFKEKLGLFLSKWAPSHLDKVLVRSKIK